VVAVVQNAMKEYSAATDAMMVRNAGLETELLCLRSSAEDTQRDVDEKESILAQLNIQLTAGTEQTAASKKEVEAALDSLMAVIQKAEMIPDTLIEHDYVPDATADVRDIKDIASEFQTQIQGIMDKVLVDGGIVVTVEHTEGSKGLHLKAVVDASASAPALPLASTVSSFMQRNAELTEEVAAELRNLQPAVTEITDAASMVVSGMEELKATEATIAEETAKLQALETERAAQEATLQALQEEVNELEAKASEAKIVISELENTCNEEHTMQSKKHQAAIQQLQKQVDDARKRVAKQRAALASNGIDAFPKAAPAIPASKPKPAPAIKALDPATVRNIFDIAGFEDDGIVVAKAKPTTKPSAKARPAPRRGAGGRG
jgi:septal ring factor EnvC (AmiA/AmiB activator)